MKKRMDRRKLQIGTYYLQSYAHSEGHVRDLKACGIDFVIGMKQRDRDVLDLFSRYGVGAVVNDVVPGWWGGNGENAGKLAEQNPPEAYEEGLRRFCDHPAIWGIDVGDEPSALDFPYYGNVFRQVERATPALFAYLNLYPNYASIASNTGEETVNQLGTATYEAHIAEYCRQVPADYLSFDFYVYSTKVPKFCQNLKTVADACRDTGRSTWVVLQVNSNKQDSRISENQLRFQASLALAYGAEVITWACYTAGWWYHQVLDENGEKTEQYEKLKTVNAELHTLGREYAKYARTETHLVGFSGTNRLDDSDTEEEANVGYFRGIRALDGGPIAVGEMTGKKNREKKAILIAAADDPYDAHPKTRSVTFTSDKGVRIAAWGGNGRVPIFRKNGAFRVEIPASGAVLVRVL